MIKLPVILARARRSEGNHRRRHRMAGRACRAGGRGRKRNGRIHPSRDADSGRAEIEGQADASRRRGEKLLIEDFRAPEEHIVIATGETKGLDGVDLFDRDCKVRFIITQQALKEGWDCSFAYVLCSVAEQKSPRAVEQLLGRVLRLPRADAQKPGRPESRLCLRHHDKLSARRRDASRRAREQRLRARRSASAGARGRPSRSVAWRKAARPSFMKNLFPKESTRRHSRRTSKPPQVDASKSI